MLMDCDDILINPNILEYIFNYNLKYNLNLIEFTVISFFENNSNLIDIEKYHHFHYFSKDIISKPQLDDIPFNLNRKNRSFNIECRIFGIK